MPSHLKFRTTVFVLLALFCCGCWAPFRSYGIPACQLGDEFRAPRRSFAPRLNLSDLTIPVAEKYRLGPHDVLEVAVPDLYQDSETKPMRITVLDDGQIHLPLAGPIDVGGKTLVECRRAIADAYADGLLLDPRINVSLLQAGTVRVLVLGQVGTPGVYELPRHLSDVGHALAMAGGLGVDAADVVEVHRSNDLPPDAPRKVNAVQHTNRGASTPLPVIEAGLQDLGHSQPTVNSFLGTSIESMTANEEGILRIPMRGFDVPELDAEDVQLGEGDVVKVPRRTAEVFFVVGQLNQRNNVRFSVGDAEREFGVGFLLPPDRDIDVVTAVAMAGYIDPIDSPTTVTVHRVLPDGEPLTVLVDLIKARYDARETIMVQPGDIIYLNPDFAWWARRTFDRIINNVLIMPYQNAIFTSWN